MTMTHIVTRLAWIAAKLVSSKRETRYASAASWRAMTADDWKRRSVCAGPMSHHSTGPATLRLTLKSWAISRTNRWKGSFLMRSSVDFW